MSKNTSLQDPVAILMSSVESQNDAINIQRCSVENQKGAINVYGNSRPSGSQQHTGHSTVYHDMVDHDILLHQIECQFKVSGIALHWLESYLRGCTSSVNISEVQSKPRTLDYGVPQGSVLGPILFIAYITPISATIQRHSLSLYYIYADDIQLYVSLDPRSQFDMHEKLNSYSLCASVITTWMSTNFLKLNSRKTEFMSNIQMNVSGHVIKLSDSVMNLGVCLDPNFKLSSHVNNVRICNFHLRNLWRIR